MLILQSNSFFLGVQKSRFRQRLPEIASSFKGHTEQLDKFIIQEILALNQKIDDDQMSIKIHGLLDNGNQNKQIEYYNSLKERADEACAWIVSSIKFREWLGHSNRDLPIPAIPASKFCILFGDMGSGKSATTSFVVDFLTSHPVFSDSMKPLVCVYYCKNDNETNKARNIYRSILSQVLKRMGQLKPMFLKWHKEAQTKNSLIDPTWDDNALRDFLVDLLQTFSRRLYLVLDGVDECDYNSRDHILQFFERFHKHGAPVNVFLSCRYDESLKERLPPERRILQMQSSRERDRIIAAYLVQRLFRHQPKEVQDMIVSELASQANGSAIWLKMVLEYLMRVSPSKGQIKRELKHIPPPQSLSKLYRKLFETAAAELPENSRVLERALETLVVSRRLLTMDELTYAVTLQVEEQKIRTLGDAEDYLIDSVRLQQLIGPFVSFSDHAGSATVRVVHQSLRDLILEKPASAWGSEGRSEDKKQRSGSLHSKLLSCCVKYLLLEDLQGKELFPEEQLDALERREDGKVIRIHTKAFANSSQRVGVLRRLQHGVR
ncbi:hypothetical protein J4E89_005022 [Alternaria sp. Ai002NY15]|nr:hypothetical protein J4E89_005022 [Alternaria sp. Ai002NY15]